MRGTADKFEETFHEEGKTDMLACMSTLWAKFVDQLAALCAQQWASGAIGA